MGNCHSEDAPPQEWQQKGKKALTTQKFYSLQEKNLWIYGTVDRLAFNHDI